MGRILAIDFGKKRTGLAVTDPLQIIATPMETIPTQEILLFIKSYVEKEDVEGFVIGMPRNLNNEETDATQGAMNLVKQLEKRFPTIQRHLIDERFTSKIAIQSMIAGGMKKKERQKKENVDKVSATLILQSYLDQNAS